MENFQNTEEVLVNAVSTTFTKNQQSTSNVEVVNSEKIKKEEVKQPHFIRRVVTGEKLLNLDLTEIPKLVEPIFPKVGVVAVAGSSDAGKSALLRQLTTSICVNDAEFLGYKLNSTHNSTIYVSTEDDESAISVLLNKQNAEKKNAEKYKGSRYLFYTDNIIEDLDDELTYQKADCVIIDTFTDIFTGDLNRTNQIRSFINEFCRLAQEHKCLFIFIHHTKKGNDETVPNKDNLLGSQGFEAKMRLVIELRKDYKNSDIRHLCIVKGNYLSSDLKKKSIVLNFDEKNMNFTKSNDSGVVFDKLTKPTKKAEYNAQVVERIQMLKSENPKDSIRKITDKLNNEGIDVTKSTVDRMIKEFEESNSNKVVAVPNSNSLTEEKMGQSIIKEYPEKDYSVYFQ